MDYETYRKKYFVTPAPPQRFECVGLHGMTLYFAEFTAAVDYYERVLGSPAYVEGTDTRGWRLGNTWLTLLDVESGSPRNMEVTIVMPTPAEAERLHAAFLDAGGTGSPPSDQLMYEPIRYCPVQDPFGTDILILSQLPGAE